MALVEFAAAKVRLFLRKTFSVLLQPQTFIFI